MGTLSWLPQNCDYYLTSKVWNDVTWTVVQVRSADSAHNPTDCINNSPLSQVLLPARYPGQGGWPASSLPGNLHPLERCRVLTRSLPVCGCSQDGRDRRGWVRQLLRLKKYSTQSEPNITEQTTLVTESKSKAIPCRKSWPLWKVQNSSIYFLWHYPALCTFNLVNVRF